MPYDAAAAALVAAGFVSGFVVAWFTRTPLEGVKTLLDFLLAAGLLRLGHADSWTSLALAALTIVIRQIAGAGLRTARGVLRGPASAARGAGSSRSDLP